jgi:hypothetical protein
MPKRRQLSGKSKSTRGVDAPSDNAQTQIGHPGDGEPDSRIFTFLSGLNEDLRTGLMAQMRILWTHTSTAIEGNSLTLGDTAFVLGEGLTVQGKPLKDHEEVVGHATAIYLMYDLLKLSSSRTEIRY